ncbi:MAG: NADH:flavin oxidoreductase [Desulfobacterota bacterium]|nr:NADH:flavin oxidoreductase [Thermodesulfobacteriota bacterium]
MINGLKLANRFVRSATYEGLAGGDGSVTPALIGLMVRLARGGVGLIISSHSYITPEGQAGPRQLGVYADVLVPGLRDLTQAVHEAGGKIVMQLAHSGGFANPKLIGQPALAPSALEGFYKTPPREMTAEDIRKMVEAFGLAALRAKEAGFDGVQIHAAHGYLLSQFVSPLLNQRRDEYGGSGENRYRALGQAAKKIRAAVGPDFPVLIKLNSQDFLEGGLTLADALHLGVRLREDGLDAIELSGGILISKNLSPSRKEAYFAEEAAAFKKKVGLPLLLVGGIRSLAVAERIIDQGAADYISLSRPFIREPELIQRWRSGDLRPASCLSDNQCFRTIMSDEGLYCAVERKEKERG